MKIKEKVKGFYEKHKLAIGVIAGVVITGAIGVMAGKLIRESEESDDYSDRVVFTKRDEEDYEFPIETTLDEIKETLRSKEDCTLYDALIADYDDGTGSLYVREAL